MHVQAQESDEFCVKWTNQSLYKNGYCSKRATQEAAKYVKIQNKKGENF